MQVAQLLAILLKVSWYNIYIINLSNRISALNAGRSLTKTSGLPRMQKSGATPKPRTKATAAKAKSVLAKDADTVMDISG